MIPVAPLSQFAIAPENPRTIRPAEAIKALAENLAANGVLAPVICYEEGGKLQITCGGTRYLAAKQAGLVHLPYDRQDKARAIEAGLAEQEGHAPLHPADQAVAFAAELERAGEDPAAAIAAKSARINVIANRVGRTFRFVEQRLALATLHPPILQALRENKITVHQAEAWANADRDRQADLWKREGKRAAIHDARSIKKLIDKADLADNDRLVKFVGEAAYKAAGGGVRQDLFSVALEPWDKAAKAKGHLDRKLVLKLAREKLAAAKARTEKEGWGHVETTLSPSRHWSSGKACKTAAERAKHAVEISIDHAGKLAYHRGLPLPGTPAKDGKKAAAQVVRNDKAEQQARDAHKRTLATACEIVGRSLHSAPRIALAVLAAQLARDEFREEFRKTGRGRDGTVVAVGSSKWRSEKPIAMASDKAWAAIRAGWIEKLLPHVPDNLERALVFDFSDHDVTALIAYCVGAAIDIDERRSAPAGWEPDRPDKPARAHLLRLATLAPPNMLEHLPAENGPPLLYQLLGAAPPATGAIADAIKAKRIAPADLCKLHPPAKAAAKARGKK